MPNLDSGFSSSSYISIKWRRRKKCWGFGDPFSKICHPSLVSSNSMRYSGFYWEPICRKSRNCNSKLGHLSEHSKSDFVIVCKPKKCCLGAAPFALGLALEPEAIGNKFNKEGSNSDCGLSEKNERGEVGLDDIKDNGIVRKEGKDRKDRSELGDETSNKVDVRALAWSLRLAKTADDVEEVLKDFEELPLPIYSSMIRGFGIDKKMDSAVALVEWLKKKRKESNGLIGPNLFIYNSLLGAMKQSEEFGAVDKVMKDMGEQGIVPNIVTFNTMMAIYLEQGRPNEALDVLVEIQEKGLAPSPVTYSTTLLAFRRMENVNHALEFFVQVREKYKNGEVGRDSGHDWENEFVKLENFTIRICCQVMRRWLVKGDHLTANVLNLLPDMDDAGVRPDRAEYERLAWACTRESHYVVAKELYRRIREMDGDISLSVCNHMIWLMGKAKKWWAALEIYEELLDRGPKPNTLSYELIVSHFNILLTAARKRGIWRWGVRLLNKMQDKGLKPGSREWNAVLVACSKASETSAAVKIFQRMVDQGEKPTIVSYGALLSALEKGKMYDEALRVWEHMCKVGVKPNLYAYTIMASIYIGQGQSEEVDSVIHEMISSGNDPTVVTYNAIISGCARNSMGSAAFEWFHRMRVRNIMPNEITYEMLIVALAKDGKPRLAYEMYLRAHNEALHLSSRAYDAVINSSQFYGASIDVSLLGPPPVEKKRILKTRKTMSDFCDLADVPRRGKPFDEEEIYYTPQAQEKQQGSIGPQAQEKQ
eukprot:TRINITY_DN18873_c0_g1_i1.p1 TRINITY_DN18873_c0_g1~~TRINITY_DN18873_c0_g1_i1.p1  ORF type:complete len:784 (-),score=148.85 TRINITY_DN18873_c0_g1_i1:161-2449(-)